MKTREQIISENPIEQVMRTAGLQLLKTTSGFQCKCPFHEDKKPSMSVDPVKGLFFCHGCQAKGSVIDFLSRIKGSSIADILKELSGDDSQPVKATVSKLRPEAVPRGREVASYSYKDELGVELFQVVRLEPKDFRQRHLENGQWVWKMEGVRKVLYNLPLIIKSNNPYVWIVEGEKDCDNLKKCGFVGTTNVGGAGKWLDGYADPIAGKEVILCGDNDAPGEAHVAKVLESICRKVKSVRRVNVPAPHKDVSDYIQSFGEDKELAAKALFEMVESASVLTGGVVVPVQTIAELEREYSEYVKVCKTSSLNLGRWLPTLGLNVRNLVPGELVMLLADTGVGKTACLQNLAMHTAPVQTLLFELELPGTLTFERFVSISNKMPGREIMGIYDKGNKVDWRSGGKLDHVCVCSKSRVSTEDISRIILQTELKTGNRPRVVMLDYIGLIQGSGKSRYEKVSNIAEELKVVAKDTGTIIVVASQVSRGNDDDPEVSLHDGKDSGSIENSSGLVLGWWRDPNNSAIINCKVLKNTKGGAGLIIPCNFDGSTMTITERTKTADC